MSLTTRCPACGTLFRVVPDQLKISEGWVRCGRCSEVFDARASLSPHLPVMTEVVETPDEAVPEAPSASESAVVAAAASGPAQPPSEPAIDLALDETFRQDPVLAAAPAGSTGSVASPSEVSVPAEGSSEPAVPEPAPEPANRATSTEGDGDGEGRVTPSATTDLPSVSFMRRARRAAFWRKPAVRWTMVLISTVLALLLLVQVAYQHRDLLALRLPGLRPVLMALCQPLQCQVGMPRRIEAVRIDASNFTRLPPEAFRLQLTLANSDSIPVAMPAIELTLTDTQDQPVLRRVLQPADLGPGTPEALPAAGEWSASVTLTVSPAAAGSVAGYRLLAFYP